MKKEKFILFFLTLLFFITGYSILLALPTVDYGATTTTMQAVADLHINPLLDHILLAGIMVMQLLKYFFPRIDGKG